jgi:hypothetical protein
MQCDAPHGVQLLMTALGVLPSPTAATFILAPGSSIAIARQTPEPRVSVPPSPPPRLA